MAVVRQSKLAESHSTRSVLPRLRHACLRHSETCVRRGKHLHASIFNWKCKHGDMQTCFSLRRRSGLLRRSQANAAVFADIKAHPGRPCVWSGGARLRGAMWRSEEGIKNKTKRPAGCWPIEPDLCAPSPALNEVYGRASAHFTWHGRTKGQITTQRIHMNVVFKENPEREKN